MLRPAKRNILGVLIDPVTYDTALEIIMEAARDRRSMIVSALAVHGVMTGVLDRKHRFRLNQFDLLVPDGQPVKWVLNLLHKAGLRDRVYGPELTKRLCERAASEGLSIYLYGSTKEVLRAFQDTLRQDYPTIQIAGAEPSRFRRIAKDEKDAFVQRVNDSQAALLFVGLGCPRQEVFAFEVGRSIHLPVIAVGAAFPFLAGHIAQAPGWMQARGLEWLFRLMTEPRRLWRRYLYLNPAYLALVALQAAGFSLSPDNTQRPVKEELYG